MFGISLPDWPWWGWALCAVGFALFGSIVGKSAAQNRTGFGTTVVSVTSYMVAVVCAGISLARFFGWFDTTY
jgi:hypothetical protein